MFTLEIYKQDKRITSRSKSVRWGMNKPGLRFIEKIDFENKSKEEIEKICESKYPEKKKFITSIHKTFVTRTHLMTGKEYQERYDLPYYCSPSSESYWSM